MPMNDRNFTEKNRSYISADIPNYDRSSYTSSANPIDKPAPPAVIDGPSTTGYEADEEEFIGRKRSASVATSRPVHADLLSKINTQRKRRHTAHAASISKHSSTALHTYNRFLQSSAGSINEDIKMMIPSTSRPKLKLETTFDKSADGTFSLEDTQEGDIKEKGNDKYDDGRVRASESEYMHERFIDLNIEPSRPPLNAEILYKARMVRSPLLQSQLEETLRSNSMIVPSLIQDSSEGRILRTKPSSEFDETRKETVQTGDTSQETRMDESWRWSIFYEDMVNCYNPPRVSIDSQSAESIRTSYEAYLDFIHPNRKLFSKE